MWPLKPEWVLEPKWVLEAILVSSTHNGRKSDATYPGEHSGSVRLDHFLLHNVCRQFLARRAQRQRRLCQRVAQLLWVMATRSE